MDSALQLDLLHFARTIDSRNAMAISRGTNLQIFSVDRDEVVNALVATGSADYDYAIASLVPLINRLNIQRRIQNPKFYERLKRDLLKGCLMPPITIAFVRKGRRGLSTKAGFQSFVRANISKAFVLDGIQRLSTLSRAYAEHPEDLALDKAIFINILICPSMDNLLYRMITLNNGQKAMTTRHQIEILSENMFEHAGDNIMLVTEKAAVRRNRGIFARSDFVLGYMAFLSNSTSVDSQKLIEEKLDELIATRILEHDPTAGGIEFEQVTTLIARLCDEDATTDKWFRVPNNLIGFCAGVRSSFDSFSHIESSSFRSFVQTIDQALSAFDISKVRLGSIRRQAVAHCVKYANVLLDASPTEITERLADLVG